MFKLFAILLFTTSTTALNFVPTQIHLALAGISPTTASPTSMTAAWYTTDQPTTPSFTQYGSQPNHLSLSSTATTTQYLSNHGYHHNALLNCSTLPIGQIVYYRVGSGATIEIPSFTKQLDYEIEVAIVIGKTCKEVTVEDAMDYVVGLMIFNDVSARDIQAREHANNVILMGKSFDGSCPLGPWLVTLDELEDPNNLEMKMYLNGVLRQDSSTANTHYNIAELVSWWSHMTLEPGDVITTGSPPGVISGMKVPEWMKSGDVMECHVEGLGCLVTNVA